MMRSDVITLVAETPEGFREYFTALSQALHPDMVFVLRDYAEYQGEKICVYHGVRYRIIRTYITAQNAIELTVEEATVDG